MTGEEKQKTKRIKYSLAVLLIFILPLAGIAVFLFGIGDYNSATFEKKEPITGNLLFLASSNTSVIKEMKILLAESYAVTHHLMEGWVGTTIEFVSICEYMSLYLNMPKEIDYVGYHNYTKCEIFRCDWEYYNESDKSSIHLTYASSSSDESRFRIQFDWKILEKITYDKERVTMPFDNPYFGKPLFSESIPLASLFLPKIERLVIQINSNSTLDSSLTTPQPSYLYFSDMGETSLTWVFGVEREVSSIQAVFQNPSLSSEKENLIFRAGLLIAFGTSMIIGGIRELLAITRKYLLTEDAEKSLQ